MDWPYAVHWPGVNEHLAESRNSAGPERGYAVRVGRDKTAYTCPANGSPLRLAAVATSPNRRKALDDHFDFAVETAESEDDSGVYISSLGGNPLLLPLLLGDLGAVLEIKGQKLHDAVFLLPLVLAGGFVVYWKSGEPVDVWSVFSESAVDRRRIGPYVAAVSTDAIEVVMRHRRV